jgi:hypothetical protein
MDALQSVAWMTDSTLHGCHLRYRSKVPCSVAAHGLARWTFALQSKRTGRGCARRLSYAARLSAQAVRRERVCPVRRVPRANEHSQATLPPGTASASRALVAKASPVPA